MEVELECREVMKPSPQRASMALPFRQYNETVEDEGGAGEEVDRRRPLPKRLRNSVDHRAHDVKLLFNTAFHQTGGGAKVNENEEDLFEADVISCLRFSHNGELLAVGDKGGRINLYQRQHDKIYRNVNYSHYHTFQSHVAEFDYLKSLEIEERISKLEWVPGPIAQSNFLLSTNDRTIKLWKVGEKTELNVENLNLKGNMKTVTALSLPRIVKGPEKVVTDLRKVYNNAHNYHINSISVNSDHETFLSSDDLRINLWNMDVTDQSFIVVDMKPESMEQLTEVITVTACHPSRCNIFAYSTSKGYTKLCDMRDSALCDNHSKLFHDSSPEFSVGSQRSWFCEVVGSISDIAFSNSGRYLATRDYISLKIWDMRMESKPLTAVPVNDYLQPHLPNLYENDAIFDRFEVSWNGSDSRLVTGSYNNFLVVADTPSSKSVYLEVTKDIRNQSKTVPLRPKRVVNMPNNSVAGGKLLKDPEEFQMSDVDISRKLLNTQWHPKENILASASGNNVYIFHDKRLFS